MRASVFCNVVALAVLLILAAGFAQAGVITDTTGLFSVGIGPNGELFSSGIGFLRIADRYDPLAPGDPRDSWGIYGVVTGLSAYADQISFGDSGVSTTGTLGANGGTLVTTTSNGYSVTQNYVFVDPNVLEIQTTVTNTGGSGQDTLFQRDVDWDVAPTGLNENTFGNPVAGNVIDSSYFGFENPDPSAGYSSSCGAGCNNTADNGAGIKLDLGVLTPGQAASFAYLYGINQTQEDVNGLIAQVNALGAYYWVATQSSENGAFPSLGSNSAILAVAPFAPLAPVPEPATMGFMAVGLALIGVRLARRQRSA
jgi:hypothetical protein